MDKDSFEYDEENWGNVVSVKELQEQIEKMKCCANCKHYTDSFVVDGHYWVYDCAKDRWPESSVKLPMEVCDEWKMKG